MRVLFSRCFVLSAALLTAPEMVQAQGEKLALDEAKTRLVCGTGTPLSAQYLPGGLLEVTCRQKVPGDSLPSELQGTGLASAAPIGAVAALVVLAVVAGSSSSTTSSTAD